MDCFNEKLGEITFQNKPSEFSKLSVKAKRYCTDGKGIVFALENSYGYGKALVDYAVNECNIYKVDVNEDNEQAYKFYLHMGYKVIGRDELDPSGKPFPILHLQQGF